MGRRGRRGSRLPLLPGTARGWCVALTLFTAADFKIHARIRTTAYDTDLVALEAQVNAAVQSYLGRSLENVGSDVTEYLSARGTSSTIRLALYPLASITSIYLDTTRVFDSTSLVTASEYVEDAASGLVQWINPDRLWVRGRKHIKVTYQGGYTAATLPEDIKLASTLWALSIWNKSQDMGISSMSVTNFSQTFRKETVPFEVRQMLAHYKKVPVLSGGM